MRWLGEFPEDFTTVVCMFTTHDGQGGPVAPLSAFEAADVLIYKNGSASQKTSTNGVTMTSPFDSIVGLHCVTIDTSNDTGDGGFWVAGAVYTLVLSPDSETVDGKTALNVIGQFGIELAEVLRPTTAGRQLDVSAGGEAGIDWANIGSPTTAVNLSATNIDTDQVVASVSGAVGSVTGLTASNLDATVSSRASAASLATAQTSIDDLPTNAELATALGTADDAVLAQVALVKAKTDNLPADPADASDIAARFTTLDTSIADLPTNAELATALGTADDATLAAIAAVETKVDTIDTVADAIKAKTDSLTFTVAGQADVNVQYVNDVQVNGVGTAGNPWGP